MGLSTTTDLLPGELKSYTPDETVLNTAENVVIVGKYRALWGITWVIMYISSFKNLNATRYYAKLLKTRLYFVPYHSETPGPRSSIPAAEQVLWYPPGV